MEKGLFEVLTEICNEKGISQEVLIDALEAALVAAYKKNFDSAENVKVDMNSQTGEIHIYAQKEVVEEVENSKYEQLDEPIEIELVVEAGKVQGYYFRYGKSIYPGNGLNGMRTHGESKLTCINQKGVKLNVIVNLSDNNLTVEISNKVIQDSKYGIRFRKISSGDKTPLQGVIFKASKTSFEGENSKPTTTDITLEANN